jgi:tetratricopeptide (TPR) repeat protein
MNDKNFPNHYIDKFKTEVIQPLIEKMLSGEFPPIPSDIAKNEFVQRTTKFYSDKEVAKKAELGCQALMEELQKFLSDADLERICNECVEGLNNYTVEKDRSHISKEQEKAVYQKLGISEETIGQIYEAGARLYKEHDFESAANVFFLLTVLDPHRYNVWLSLGLSEFQSGNCEVSLNVFSVASAIAVNSPFPYIYSAECCLKNGNMKEAAKFLTLAEEALTRGHHDVRGHLTDYIAKLRKQSQSQSH